MKAQRRRQGALFMAPEGYRDKAKGSARLAQYGAMDGAKLLFAKKAGAEIGFGEQLARIGAAGRLNWQGIAGQASGEVVWRQWKNKTTKGIEMAMELAKQISARVGVPEKVASGGLYALGAVALGVFLGPVGLAVAGAAQGALDGIAQARGKSDEDAVPKNVGWAAGLLLTDGFLGAGAFAASSYFGKLVAQKLAERAGGRSPARRFGR